MQDVARAGRLAPSNWAMKDTRRWARREDRPPLSSPEAMPLQLRVVKSMSPNSRRRRSINQPRTDSPATALTSSFVLPRGRT